MAFVPFLGGHVHHHAAPQDATTSPLPKGTGGDGDVRSLDVYVDGDRLHLLYAKTESGESLARLYHRVSTDQGGSWSEPVAIDTGPSAPLARGRGTDFQIAAKGSDLVAIWIMAGSGYGGRGPLGSAVSADGGQSWSLGTSPSDFGGDGDHGFIDIVALPEGRFQTVWLDDREGTGKGLFTARSDDGGGSWGENVVIDAETCECCPNTIQVDAAGTLYTLYRDREPRDMGLARSQDEGRTWQGQPSPGAFDWQFNGCPHVGGGLAIEGTGASTRLHTLVWTGKEGVAGIHYQQKGTSAANWTPPQRLAGRSATQPDLAIDSVGRLAAVWMERIDGSARVRCRFSSDGGESWSEPETLGEPARYPEYPRVVAVGENFHCFWTENDGTNIVWRHQRLGS